MLTNNRLTEGRHQWEEARDVFCVCFSHTQDELTRKGFDETHRTSIWAYGLLGQSEEFIIAEMGIVQCLF